MTYWPETIYLLPDTGDNGDTTWCDDPAPGVNDDPKNAIAYRRLDLNHTWQPIETAPRDRPIVVYAPAYDGLPAIVGIVQYHSDAGFCVDELRHVTLWMDAPGMTNLENGRHT
jgi:hypothetical protein